jgi:hypothetical protein
VRETQLERGALRFVLEVLNVYDRQNVCCVDEFTFTPRPNGSVRVDRQEGFWLKRVPSFSIEWEF